MSGHEKKITVTRTRSRSCCTRDPGSRADYFSCKILGFVWNLIASLVRKLKISINNSLHTRSNIVLVLFLDSLKAFQLHFCQLLGSKTLLFSSLLKRINYSICVSCFLLIQQSILCISLKNHQWTQDARVELNVST